MADNLIRLQILLKQLENPDKVKQKLISERIRAETLRCC
jgi:hypothetical protein